MWRKFEYLDMAKNVLNIGATAIFSEILQAFRIYTNSKQMNTSKVYRRIYKRTFAKKTQHYIFLRTVL